MQYDLTKINRYSTWQRVVEIKKGWSDDTKYYIETDSQEKYLLRISDRSSLTSEKILYDLVKDLSSESLNVSNLLESGLCNTDQNTYRLFSWVEGVELLNEIRQFTIGKQYSLGLEAGNILRVIHNKRSSLFQRNWKEYFNRKIDRNIRNYKKCGERFMQDEALINYLNHNRKFLVNRPQCLHHGDYHIGNMLINKEGHLGVIDFNRLDYGDPWEEFNRMPWCATESSLFATGLLHGYFEKEPTEDFFQLMSLYIGSNQLGGFAWAKAYGKKELKVLKTQTKAVTSWYNDFKEIVPSWYKTKREVKKLLEQSNLANP